jgi:transcription elongation factor GreA
MQEGKYYLTKEGIEKIKEELERLQERKQILLNGQGPRSFRFGEVEAEYIAFREDLGRVRLRIKELQDVLENYELIKLPPKDRRDEVYLGAQVSVEMDGVVEDFRIVSTAESDPANKKISNHSPIGKALLGKKVGEEIKVKTPMVNHVCRILKIKYENESS